jgi:hypothetical protein
MEIIFQYEILIQQMVEQGFDWTAFFDKQETSDLNNSPQQRVTMTMLSAGQGISKGQEVVKLLGEMKFWLEKSPLRSRKALPGSDWKHLCCTE